MQKMTIGTTTDFMKKYKQGDIVFVPFPYTDNLSISKQRPVIILSKNSINRTSYIVAKVTSVIRNDYFSFPIFKTLTYQNQVK